MALHAVASMFLQRGHVNAPSLVSCLLARLIFKHASFDGYLPSEHDVCASSRASGVRESQHKAEISQLRPSTFNGKGK